MALCYNCGVSGAVIVRSGGQRSGLWPGPGAVASGASLRNRPPAFALDMALVATGLGLGRLCSGSPSEPVGVNSSNSVPRGRPAAIPEAPAGAPSPGQGSVFDLRPKGFRGRRLNRAGGRLVRPFVGRSIVVVPAASSPVTLMLRRGEAYSSAWVCGLLLWCQNAVH